MKQLGVSRWAMEGVAGPLARATVEDGTTPEEFLRPEFWSHVSAGMRRFQEIQILDECGQWMAHAIVADCGRNWARVVLDRVTSLAGEEIETEDPKRAFKIEYRAHERYRIRRLADNAIVASGIASKKDADRQLDEHLKALAA